MKPHHQLIPVLIATCLGCSIALASDVLVYPKQGQSPQQQQQDEFECFSWARGQTGFDPMATPQATTPPPASERQQGGLGRGALGGAVVGGVLGGSDGARTGAIAGGVIGGVRRHDQVQREQHAQQQWQQQQATQHAQQRNNFNRAFAACMSGRGYSVQ